MPLDHDAIQKMIDDTITERFVNIGIDDQGYDAVKRTRDNFELVNDLRKSRDNRKKFLSGGFRDIMSTFAGQVIWATAVFCFIWLLEYIKGVLKIGTGTHQ
jgi:hypothetical protein